MTNRTNLELLIGTILLLACVLFSGAFTIIYPLLSKKFFATPLGRAVWYRELASFFALLVVVLASDLLWGPDFPWRPTVRIAAFALIPITIINLFRLMVLLQVSKKYRARYEAKHHPDLTLTGEISSPDTSKPVNPITDKDRA